MMKEPLVSVVIPTYNHAQFIGNAIQSVLDQKYQNFEVIVVDNHSTDQTNEVLQAFGNAVRMIKVHNNGVIAVSRNAGIRAAQGSVVAFLDSDDCWTADKLHRCIEKIDVGADIVFHDMAIEGERSFYHQRRLKGRKMLSPVLTDLLVNGNAIINSTVVVKKDLLEQIGYISEDAEMVAAEDFNTWIRIAAVTESFVYLPVILGSYRIHSSGMSRKDMSQPMKKATAAFMDRLSGKQRNKAEARIGYAHVRSLFVNGKAARVSMTELMFIVRHGPWAMKIKSLYMMLNRLRHKEAVKKGK
ncbi:glycosyltransferase [Sediminibacterium roseum]|uniref:Glycosyltransferase n=1 Tax=Sediminibacterium roseum TaxID=1978412 RepID=A0ABW9ZPS3_9BACT|nr:glycosyltransferase [Sediminibacterium roseum]NCI49097.1 glycosyltransferase [Sediminibacterium roseum]